MDLLLSKPKYRARPIRSIAALARCLRMDESALIALAQSANSMWRTVKPKPGSSRQTFDAIGMLKDVHMRLKMRIFSKVDFPAYLQGSLKGRDYVTNALLHMDKQILICEDVKGFFPSVSSAYVEDVWCCFFGFSPEVAKILTQLTTKDGSLPQGSISSSFLANLVMWRHEPLLHAKLEQRNIVYSRYVDDMVISSELHIDKKTQTWIIGQLYGMLAQHGLKASRKKHEVFSASERMIATKLVVNRKPSLKRTHRSQIRAQVRQLEIAAQDCFSEVELQEALKQASQRVGQLGRFHKTSAKKLKERITIVRDGLSFDNRPVTTVGRSVSIG